MINGGTGADTASYIGSSTGVNVNLTTGAASGGDAAGDSYVSIENLIGSAFDDTLTGDAGGNIISGGDGNDVLAGAAGDDTLTGGTGNDSIYGGDGNDLFVYAVGDGQDTIQSGSGWTDALRLDGMEGSTMLTDTGVAGSGWTLALNANSSVTSRSAAKIELSSDAAGIIYFEDGGHIVFDGMEEIRF